MNSYEIIYLHSNFITFFYSRVVDVMLPFLKYNFANPSGTYHFGMSVHEATKRSRVHVAAFIEAEENEILFTNGYSEAINIALKGVTESNSVKGRHNVIRFSLRKLNTIKEVKEVCKIIFILSQIITDTN